MKDQNRFRSTIPNTRTVQDVIAGFLTRKFGTAWFFILNATFFLWWILANLGYFGVTPFDPFPFGLLTLIVSLEAIFLSIIVLMSQNLAAKMGDVRQKLDLEVDVRAEEEITKILILLDDLHAHFGITKHDDAELAVMKQKTDLTRLRKEVEKSEEL